MKKHILTQCSITLSVVLSFILVGCGGGGGEAPAPDGDVQPEPQVSAVDTLKAAAGTIEPEEDQVKVTEAIVVFNKTTTLTPFFENSYGCVVFPAIGKGGLGIGGAHGNGWVFSQGDLTGESKMTQVTIGLQAGGQAFRQIIFFENEAAYTTFTSGNFEFGAQASAVALTEGANASTSTAGGSASGAGEGQSKDDYTDGMAIFTQAKGGLMYEASVGGQKFGFKASGE